MKKIMKCELCAHISRGSKGQGEDKRVEMEKPAHAHINHALLEVLCGEEDDGGGGGWGGDEDDESQLHGLVCG